MNRKKKINQTLKAKAKKANKKLLTGNKPQYISKAERALLAGTEVEALVSSSLSSEPSPSTKAD
ncbi:MULTISPECIES: DUF2986 domain-containing protein [Pseudomonadati]|uniref:DUF2986 domain-containing protein n=1 Tax=Shewanella aestuarii TaxID=1028752 RepID=A0ABT0L5R6_9GAMM|nr:DUF2986 domain-containing protein [Shewanella aestuarii]MCL1118561.1 DUF2986 domain-containing protein [Shewanella aestuarii]GGN83124.1 hypothetical protein GCM10009193_30990 [Shewanella aestuarii]